MCLGGEHYAQGALPVAKTHGTRRTGAWGGPGDRSGQVRKM